MTTKKYHHCLYVIELDPSVLENQTFLTANPEYVSKAGFPPLYVGMTGRTPQIRFDQHRSGYKANRYARRFGVRLRPDLVLFPGTHAYADAQELEAALADELRKRGHAAWQH